MKTKLISLTLAAACLLLLCAMPIRLRAATFFVRSTNDSGSGTLRAALANAANGDTIWLEFYLSGTITLTSGQLDVSNSVNILGPGAGLLTVSGNNSSRVFSVTGTNVSISGLTIANGSTYDHGAGIYAGGGPSSVLAVSSCVITNNSASGNGGGVYNSHGVTMTVSNCTVSGNSAPSGSGGGIYNGGVLTVIASTLNDNSADYSGGGIINWGYGGSATLTVNASTFSGNSARYGNGGGGIYNWGTFGSPGSATLTINASTFSGNSAGSGVGGGIYNTSATLDIGDTILNAGASGANIYDNSGLVTSHGYNLASDNGGGLLTKPTDQINTDPMLGPLRNNGGRTRTHALLSGSPAMDKGKTNAIPALAGSTDQRGLPRSLDNPSLANATGGDGSDIGAFETRYQYVTNTADSGPGTVRQALVDGDIVDATGVSGTITLTNGQLNVPTSVTLFGPGPGALTVSGNHASGVFNVTGGNVDISGLTIANGYGAINGAGICAGAGPGSVLTVSWCVITNNHTTLDGGGIYINPSITMTISNCTVSGNSSRSQFGGGGGTYNGGALAVIGSTLSGNTASAYGGGIYNNSSTLTLVASTLSGNSAGVTGSSIFNNGNLVRVTINASTLSINSWEVSIFTPSSAGNAFLEIGNTILKTGGSSHNLYINSGTVISDGYNLSSDNGGGFLTAAGDQINTDPKLGPLQDNGGPTWTHALLAGSPAIDNGKANAVPDLAHNIDQRGLTRPADFFTLPNSPSGDGSDIGAFEIQYSPVVSSAADSGLGTLREALASATNGTTVDATGVSGTITLTNGQLNVPNSVTLLGPGAGALTVSGNHASGVFNVTGTNVAISGLTIANGYGAVSGAGIYAGAGPGCVLTVSGCVITNNHTTLDGGGIYDAGVTLTISNCTISGSSAGGSGGGIYSSNSALAVVASTISGNVAGSSGGGIMNSSQSGASTTLTIIASTLNNNFASWGGGIWSGVGSFSSGYATVIIDASTISGNSASGGDSGISSEGAWGGHVALLLNASTVSGNSGFGIYSDGRFGGSATVEIGDTILNAGPSASTIYNQPGGIVISDGYNLSSDAGGGFLTATGDQINTDPMLGALQDNGGPTWTHALLAGSPAMDKGKTNAIPALARSTDQRGLARLADFACIPNATAGDGSDIGAVESQDTNANGLPDDWELACFGNLNQSATGDFDGDGQNNSFEFLAGTNPTNSASAFWLRAATVAGQPNQRNLIFSPWASGRIYTPQFTTNLATTVFAPLTGYDTTTNGAEVIVTDLNATGQQKFYRIGISFP